MTFSGNLRFSAWVLIAGIFFASGCDFVYRVLQKEGAEEKELLGDIIPMESNARVLKVQTLLKLYGYNVGNPDGVLGVNTRVAVQKFQEDNGLKVTRFVDYATWDNLLYFEDIGLVEDDKLNVSVVQKALKNAGFDPGAVDGRSGRKTQEAIRAFQKSSGLSPDGRVGFQTLNELSKFIPTQE